jgi:alpha-L-fucosidase
MAEITDAMHKTSEEDQYVPPVESVVQQHLEWFRDLKLGFMMHWSPACQLGLIESWPLCDEMQSWSQVRLDWADIEKCKEHYWTANTTFNPVKFRPDRWAKLAKNCGFKYVLFTTKHHDGFCMFDTKTTDYRITAPDCPFSHNPQADITKEIFNAFRHEGLGVSAYFSKPDWHSQYFWRDEFGKPKTTNTNYKIHENPELWNRFVKYTHEQLREITSNYGKIDVLWLDGGWVRPGPLGQDLHLENIIPEIRGTKQPHLIVCDRTVGGLYENVLTPEQTIPDHPIHVPWETCLTLGRYWSFHYTDQYKSTRQVIHILIEVVAKGGNLALNLTPQPDGELPEGAMEIIRSLGRWLEVNGEGIYGSRIVENDHIVDRFDYDGTTWYTQGKNCIYAFRLYQGLAVLPARFRFTAKRKIAGVRLLRGGCDIPFTQEGDFVEIYPSNIIGMDNAEYADCFRMDFA